MNPTLKPRVNVFKGQIACDDTTDTAFIDPSFYLDSSEITDTDPFNNDSNTTSIDLANFDSSEVSNTDSMFNDSSEITDIDFIYL